MSVNIPNIGNNLDALMNGIRTGSNFYTNLMNPILQREHLKQAADLDREHQKQLENHFQMNFGLSKQAAARAAQAAADAHKKMDPMYEINQYKALEDWVKGQGAAQQEGSQQMNGAEQPTMPNQEMGEGKGMFTPQGMQEGQQSPQMGANTQQPNGMSGQDIELLKAHPMLRGFAKKHLGFDPMAQAPQTPAEKQAAALDLFKQKQAIKNGNIGDNVPITTAMKTKLQGVVTGVDNSLPVIKELIDNFKNLPTGAETWNPSAYASYNAKANSIIEPLINAFGLNVTDATKDMMHEQVFRKTNEPLAKYRDRLVDLAKEIIRRRDDSFKSIKSGSINPKSEFTNEFFENLAAPTVHLIGPNGEDYDVPESEVNTILQKNPGVRRG